MSLTRIGSLTLDHEQVGKDNLQDKVIDVSKLDVDNAPAGSILSTDGNGKLLFVSPEEIVRDLHTPQVETKITGSSDDNDVSITASGILLNDLDDVDVLGVTDAQVLMFDDTSGLWLSRTLEFSIDDLSDVNSPNPQMGNVLRWDGSAWTSTIDVQRLDDITDVDACCAEEGQILIYRDGVTSWVAEEMPLAQLHLDDLLDVDIPNAVDRQIIRFDETSGNWMLDELDVINDLADVDDSAKIDLASLVYSEATQQWEAKHLILDELADVDADGASLGQVLRFDGVKWYADYETPGVRKFGDLIDVEMRNLSDGNIMRYDETTLTWYPGDDITGARRINELEDVNTALAVDGGLLMYNEAADTWLASDKVIPELIEDLTNVTVAEAAAGHILQYNGTYWRNVVQDIGARYIDELLDVCICSTPEEGHILTFDADTGQWINVPNAAVPQKLTDLTDVEAPAPDAGDTIIWNPDPAGDGTVPGQWESGVSGSVQFLDDLLDVDAPAPQIGEVIKWNGTNWVTSPENCCDDNGGGGGPTTQYLDDLLDVASATALDGQVIAWNAGTGLWLPADQSGGARVLTDLLDVDVDSATDGQSLVYRAATNEWVPVTVSGGGTGEGEENDGGNLGNGIGVYAGKLGATLQFQSLVAGNNITITEDGNEITIESTATGGGGGLDAVEDDPAPTLGGPLNVDEQAIFDAVSISGASGQALALSGDAITIHNLVYPDADGQTGQALTTDGSGNLYWSDAATGSTSWDDIENKPTTFPPELHGHTISQVDGLQDELDGKSNTDHVHFTGQLE